MSIEALSWGFRQNISVPGAKLVLLALCDFADESWSCFPGQETLAVKTSQSERTVRRHLDWLEAEGFIVSRARFANGRRTSNRYTIHTPRPSTPPPPPNSQPSEADPESEAGGHGADAEAGPAPSGEGDTPAQPPSGEATPHHDEKGAKQTAKVTGGQDDHRSDHAEQPAKMTGEPSGNHQRNNPLPPADGDADDGADHAESEPESDPDAIGDADPGGDCPAHPQAPAANCRGCGTNPRSLRAAEVERVRTEKAARARARDQRWFDEQGKRRTLAEQQEAQGVLEGPRKAAREALRRRPRRSNTRDRSIPDRDG